MSVNPAIDEVRSKTGIDNSFLLTLDWIIHLFKRSSSSFKSLMTNFLLFFPVLSKWKLLIPIFLGKTKSEYQLSPTCAILLGSSFSLIN